MLKLIFMIAECGVVNFLRICYVICSSLLLLRRITFTRDGFLYVCKDLI